MTKDKAVLDAAYQAAAEAIIEKLKEGKDVACLTLGDPTIYSTYIYIHRLVKAQGYATQIINGIPSFCAVSAKLGDNSGGKCDHFFGRTGTEGAEFPESFCGSSGRDADYILCDSYSGTSGIFLAD